MAADGASHDWPAKVYYLTASVKKRVAIKVMSYLKMKVMATFVPTRNFKSTKLNKIA